MVTVHLKYTDVGTIEIPLNSPKSLNSILEECTKRTGIEFGGVIAVCNGKVIQPTDSVEDGDIVRVFPALSGG